MRRSRVFLLALVALIIIPFSTAAQELDVTLGRQPRVPDCQTLPSNIKASRAGRALVLAVAAMSETFRRQCAAVASAPHLQVVIHVVGRLESSTARARTEFSRDAENRVKAIMLVPISLDSAELLAHEFEHVVEQLDGVCLHTMLRQGDPGVSVGAGGAFETFRARTAGRQVAAEVAAGRHLARQGR